jgi:hypothetical protein
MTTPTLVAEAPVTGTAAIDTGVQRILDAPPEAAPTSLADLMRLGSMLTGQAHGTFVDAKGNTCALAAAYTGALAFGIVNA